MTAFSNDIEFEQALSDLERAPDLDALAALENEYGDYLFDRGRKFKAQQHYHRAYDHYIRLGDRDSANEALWKAAKTHRFLGSFDRALAAFQRLLDDSESHGSSRFRAATLSEMGDILRMAGRMSEAEQFHLRSLSLLEEHEVSMEKIQAHHCLAKFHLAQFELEEAAAHLNVVWQALEIVRDLEKNKSCQIMLTRARLNLLEGRSPEAVTQLNDMVSGLDRINDMALAAIISLNLSLALLTSGEIEGASNSAKQATDLFDNCGHWRVNEALQIVARCYLAQDNIEAAQQAASRASDGYLNLGLYDRINQVEQSMYVASVSRVLELTKDELRHEFRNVGV